MKQINKEHFIKEKREDYNLFVIFWWCEKYIWVADYILFAFFFFWSKKRRRQVASPHKNNERKLLLAEIGALNIKNLIKWGYEVGKTLRFPKRTLLHLHTKHDINLSFVFVSVDFISDFGRLFRKIVRLVRVGHKVVQLRVLWLKENDCTWGVMHGEPYAVLQFVSLEFYSRLTKWINFVATHLL